MANGIYGVNCAKPIRTIDFGNGSGVYYPIEPMENDSFNGKTVLTLLAATAGAVIFRKNIGKFVSKHFPKVAEWSAKNIIKPASEFLAKHSDNKIVKGIQTVLNKTATWGEKATAWLTKTFGSGVASAEKAATTAAEDVNVLNINHRHSINL